MTDDSMLVDSEGRRICAYRHLIEEDYQCMRSALDGEAYCALHLQSDDKRLSDFLSEVRKSIRNPAEGCYDLIGAYFPKSVPHAFFYNAVDEYVHTLDLRAAVFACSVTFYSRTFCTQARFDGAVFQDYADFTHTVFEEGAEFGGATFASFNADAARFAANTSFTLATFNGIASFRGTVFGNEAMFVESTFNDTAWFNLAKFKGTLCAENSSFHGAADFSGAEFGGDNTILSDSLSLYPVSFEECTFDGKTDFTDSVFRVPTDFLSARFRERAIFAKTVFSDFVGFRYALFEQSALFRGTQFLKNANLTAVVSLNPTLMQFMDAVDLSRVQFAESDVSRWSFQSVKWRDIHRSLVWHWGPTCIGVADEVEPRSGEPRSPETLQVLYRRLQDNYENAHGYGTAGDFHIGAMETRRQSQGRKNPSWWLLSAYRFVSLYGERWLWAAGLLVALLVISAVGVSVASVNVGFVLALNNCVRIVTLQSNLLLAPTSELGAWGETLLRLFGALQIAVLALAVRRQVQR